MGDFGLNIYWHSLSLILVFWYAEVVGLEPKVAGWIYAAGLFWDAVSDPLVASFAANNRSRWGAYRPFLLFGSFGLGASFCLLFWKPPLTGIALLAALLAAGMLFRTCYTLVAVPYSALSSRLTFDSDERAELSGVRMFFAFGGMLCVSIFFFPLSRFFAQGNETEPQGYLLTSALGASVATLALIGCFFLTNEREPIGVRDQRRGMSFASFSEAFKRNRALRILMLLLIANAAANACLFIPLAFYLEANSDIFAHKEFILASFAAATLVGTPFWTIIARAFGKRRCWLAAALWMSVTGISLAVFGPVIVSGIPVQIVLFGLGASAFAVVIWALIPDTVEYGQYSYGRRDEGPVFGASLLVQKSSGALTGLAIGYILSGIGYDPALDLQTAQTTDRLETFVALAPPFLLLVAAVIIWLMPVSRNLHAQIVDELSR